LRDTSLVSDACNASLALTEHHDWVPEAAKRLMIGGNILWHAMCAEWVKRCLSDDEASRIKQYVEDRISDYA
jgi:hypothetical protein